MHIAFLTPEFPHQELNHAAGIGTSVYNMALSLVKKGIKTSVVVYSQERNNTFDFQGIRIHAIKHKKYPFLGWYLYRKHIQRSLNRLIISEDINIVEAPDWTGITAFMKFKIPHVIRLHGSDTFFCELERRPVKRKNYFFEQRALKKAVSVVSVSAFVKEETKRLFKINIHGPVIPNGVDLQAFTNRSPLSFERNTILYFGTIIRKKGVLELAKIFNHVVEKNPDAKLILLGKDNFDVKTGSSSTYQLMEELFTQEAMERVSYLGKVPYNVVKEHILSAHICVFPSLAESFGMVNIEAMALSKLVISSNYGWTQEIIDENVNGFMEDPKKIKTFANKICKVMNDKELLERITDNSRKKIAHEFNIDHLAERNIKFYKNIIDGTNAEVN